MKGLKNCVLADIETTIFIPVTYISENLQGHMQKKSALNNMSDEL